jgi:hypothetical protein
MARWDYLSDHKARALVRSALRTMRKSEGGPFTNREIKEIVQNVMELPAEECDIANWTKERCRVLIARLLVRRLIHDRRAEPGAGATRDR